MSGFDFKLTVDEVARYLFTGLAIGWGYLLATDTAANPWFAGTQWPTKPLFGSVCIAFLLFFLGYLTFQTYRGVVYPYMVISLRGWPGLSPKYKYLRQLARQLNVPINPRTAEDLYGILRGKLLKEEYPDRFPAMATGIHVMYCCGLILLACSLPRLNPLVIVFFLLVLAAVASDYRYELMEVRILEANELIVQEELRRKRTRAGNGQTGQHTERTDAAGIDSE